MNDEICWKFLAIKLNKINLNFHLIIIKNINKSKIKLICDILKI